MSVVQVQQQQSVSGDDDNYFADLSDNENEKVTVRIILAQENK